MVHLLPPGTSTLAPPGCAVFPATSGKPPGATLMRPGRRAATSLLPLGVSAQSKISFSFLSSRRGSNMNAPDFFSLGCFSPPGLEHACRKEPCLGHGPSCHRGRCVNITRACAHVSGSWTFHGRLAEMNFRDGLLDL